MTSFALCKRNRNGVKVYVTHPGAKNSYSPRLSDARIFPTREAAEADRCGDEWIEPL